MIKVLSQKKKPKSPGENCSKGIYFSIHLPICAYDFTSYFIMFLFIIGDG